MPNLPLLLLYSVLLFCVSFAGGRVGLKLNLRHRTLQLSLSFVSGLVLGVALLHLLPESVHHLDDAGKAGIWLLGGLLCIFFLERLFSFHHHEEGQSDHGHSRGVPWQGATAGLTIHSLLAGLALGAATTDDHAGVGVLLAIVLHKPFDAFAITTLMREERSDFRKNLANILFALVVPIGLFAFHAGFRQPGDYLLGAIMAFSAGIFLCISLSDLLPELQFHSHDRMPMSLMLLAGIGVAWVATFAEH